MMIEWLNDGEREQLGRKNILIRDIERCPYLPKDSEYALWIHRDDLRLDNISKQRTALRKDSERFLNYPNSIIQDMAKFICEFLEK